MRRASIITFFVLLFVVVIVVSGAFTRGLTLLQSSRIASLLASKQGVWHNATGPVHVDASSFFTAGFQINSAADAQDAKRDGIQRAFMYDGISAEDTALGRTFKDLKIAQVDGKISSYLYSYECHRLYQLHLANQHYCSQNDPEMSHEKLISLVKKEVAAAKKTTLRAGYWILDDWPSSDEGSARSLLQEITGVIHAQDPGTPTICGFGALLGVNYHDNLEPGVVKNYSPGGCDMVGIYIYSESVSDPATSNTSFDWSMSSILPAMLNGLSQQGWDERAAPLMGIVQAWGGTRIDVNGYYEIPPSAEAIEQQSLSFCKSGASGINFYGWGDSTVSDLQTPANNSEIKRGVVGGINACRQYWEQQATPARGATNLISQGIPGGEFLHRMEAALREKPE